MVEVVIDPTQKAVGQGAIVIGKRMPWRIRQEENRVRDPSTTPRTATTATLIALGTDVPNA